MTEEMGPAVDGRPQRVNGTKGGAGKTCSRLDGTGIRGPNSGIPNLEDCRRGLLSLPKLKALFERQFKACNLSKRQLGERSFRSAIKDSGIVAVL